MKKTLLSLTLTGFAVAAMAQQNGPIDRDQQARTIKSDGHQNSDGLQAAPSTTNPLGWRGTAFWTEDFSGGVIPSGWTNADVGTVAPTPDVTFVWSSDAAAVGVAALGYAPSSTFNSATAANGYLWANSDRGLASAPLTTHVTELTTTAIDCSGQPSVQLNFQSLIGVFDLDANVNAVVRVSTDMSNWTTYQAFPCLVTGAAAPPCARWSANPQMVSVDITPTAANQSTVYIQWQWTGGWEYFWAIDDVELAPLPEYERVLGLAYMSHVGDGLEYHRIPTSQLFADFILGVSASNVGANLQTNVTLNAVVTAPGGGTAFSASENFAQIAPGDTATMEQTVTLPGGLATGLYTVNFTITSDQDALEANPDDDAYERRFELTDNKYSLDGIGVHPPAIEATASLGTNSFANNEDGLMLFTYFEIAEAMDAYGMEAMLAVGTVVNSQLIFSIHTAADIDNDVVNSPLADSDFITVTNAHVSSGMVSGAFFGGAVTLQPGGYYAAVALYSNAGANIIRILDDITVPQPDGASLIYLPVAPSPANPAGVYGNGIAHAIRLSSDPEMSINDRAGELNGVSMYPNPTDGLLWINTEHAGNHVIEVLDMVGALVHMANFNHLTTIDLGGLAKGMYMVRIANDKGSMASRITVQ